MTLGTFTATFIFCMAVLLQLSGRGHRSLPQISVNVALLLGLTSFGVLVYFINHVAVSLQAPIVVERVSKELHAAILHELPDPADDLPGNVWIDEDYSIPTLDTPPNIIIMAAASGYVQARDDEQLLSVATHKDLILQLLHEPGDFIAKGTPLAKVWGGADLPSLGHTIHTAFMLGPQRTLVQDVTFGINELAEVAIRALSPAINDPFTAMTCLNWLGSALCQVCTRRFPTPVLRDKAGCVRLIRTPVTFALLTDAAFSQIREYGRNSTAVTLRLMETIFVVAQCATTAGQRAVLLHHATLVQLGCNTGLAEAAGQARIADCYEKVSTLLQGTADSKS